MPCYEVDGFDFFAVHDAAGVAIERARNGDGPSMLHVKLARYFGHFEGDATTYRAPGEVDRIRAEQDCLRRFRRLVTEAALLDSGELDAVDHAAAEAVELSVRGAKAGMPPGDADLLTDVYVAY